MTKPKPTPEQIQRACDLANALREDDYWRVTDYDRGSVFSAIHALADTIAELDAEKARAEKAEADLREIGRVAEDGAWNHPSAARNSQRVAALAATYRAETDPLVEALRDLAVDPVPFAANLRAELAKRGLAFTKCDPERLPV